MGSLLSMTDRSRPPVRLLRLARARTAFGSAVGGCGVMLPNSSLPLVTLPLRGSTRNPAEDPGAVQAIWIGWPLPKKSNFTPCWALVRSKLPLVGLMMMGEQQRTEELGLVLLLELLGQGMQASADPLLKTIPPATMAVAAKPRRSFRISRDPFQSRPGTAGTSTYRRPRNNRTAGLISCDVSAQ